MIVGLILRLFFFYCLFVFIKKLVSAFLRYLANKNLGSGNNPTRQKSYAKSTDGAKTFEADYKVVKDTNKDKDKE